MSIKLSLKIRLAAAQWDVPELRPTLRPTCARRRCLGFVGAVVVLSTGPRLVRHGLEEAGEAAESIPACIL